MRVPAPASLKLSRDELLRDVRERLAERLPQYSDDQYDPTDPGWIMLEQSAWLVEILSEQLDNYPFSVLQHVMHVIGGDLLPARPAVGVVVARVARHGTLELDPTKAGDVKFFTPENENQETMEFVPVEPRVFLSGGRIASIVEWTGTQLNLALAPGDEEPGNLSQVVGWQAPQIPSELFQQEQVSYTVATNKPKDTEKEFQSAIELFDKRKIGWLSLTAEAVGKDRVRLEARVDLARPFVETVPEGFTQGGDIAAHWGVLDDSTWTPNVRVRRHPLLPPGMRGTRPMPGLEDGQIQITDVPENFPVDQLLERIPAPMPSDVVDAIWSTLGNLNTRLASLKPRVERHFPAATDPAEPSWAAAALTTNVWEAIARQGPALVAHYDGITPSGQAKLRIGLVLDPGDAHRKLKIDIFEVDPEDNVPRSPLTWDVAWRMPGVMAKDGGTAVEIVAIDVKVSPTSKGLVVAYYSTCHAFLLNPLLVTNMPAAADGREVEVRRNVPEPMSLLYEDVVTGDVVTQVLRDPVPRQAAQLLRNFPLARFSVGNQEDIVDYEGVRIDASSGTVTVNSPDPNGYSRQFRPGNSIRLDWYRRTDGSWGNVPAGHINIVEQPGEGSPSIDAVVNPVGTVFGTDRESPKAAVERLFGPAGGMPVLPSDFEALFRQALGQRAEGWVIRVWSYAERSLISSALWPFDKGASQPDASTQALRAELTGAGPDTLLVIVGPREGTMSDLDFESARAVILKRVDQLKERLRSVRGAVVGRFWPLELQYTGDKPEAVLPLWDTTGLSGSLVDQKGRAVPPLVDTLLLNAAVTNVKEKEGGWS